MKIEEWLPTVGALALKALAGDRTEFHGASKKKVIEFILNDPEARERAEESMRITEGVK